MSVGMASPMGSRSTQAGSSSGNNQAGMNLFSKIQQLKSGGSSSAPEGYLQGKIKNYTPEQSQLFRQSFQNVSPDSYLSRLASGDQDIFNEIEAPAFRQFEQLQGQNAARFSGMGMGARRGSGFQNFQNQATSDFAQQLQSNRHSLRQQAIKDLMGMSNELLNQRPYENYLVPEQMPWEQQLGLGAVQGLASGFSKSFGGF